MGSTTDEARHRQGGVTHQSWFPTRRIERKASRGPCMTARQSGTSEVTGRHVRTKRTLMQDWIKAARPAVWTRRSGVEISTSETHPARQRMLHVVGVKLTNRSDRDRVRRHPEFPAESVNVVKPMPPTANTQSDMNAVPPSSNGRRPTLSTR